MTYTAKHSAAFINAIADEGTKAEAVEWLQRTWDDLVEAQSALAQRGEHLPLDLDHEPADLDEAKEMLRRARALTFTSLDGLHRAMDAAKQQVEAQRGEPVVPAGNRVLLARSYENVMHMVWCEATPEEVDGIRLSKTEYAWATLEVERK